MNGFYKVAQSGGSYVVATFYNPITKEVKTCCVRDYDYADGSRDNDELYFMEIDKTAKTQWLHDKGVILEGDEVEVIKGRKYKRGTRFVVKKIYPYKDKYGRWVADYAYFGDGEKCNVENLKLV